jgi:hypothetical protein
MLSDTSFRFNLKKVILNVVRKNVFFFFVKTVTVRIFFKHREKFYCVHGLKACWPNSIKKNPVPIHFICSQFIFNVKET